MIKYIIIIIILLILIYINEDTFEHMGNNNFSSLNVTNNIYNSNEYIELTNLFKCDKYFIIPIFVIFTH